MWKKIMHHLNCKILGYKKSHWKMGEHNELIALILNLFKTQCMSYMYVRIQKM